jgi:uncharacterized membrane protein
MQYYHPFFGLGDLIQLVIFIIIIAVVIRVVTGGRHHRWHRHLAGKSAALELLEERYVKGEITKEEFDTKKRDLTA